MTELSDEDYLAQLDMFIERSHKIRDSTDKQSIREYARLVEDMISVKAIRNSESEALLVKISLSVMNHCLVVGRVDDEYVQNLKNVICLLLDSAIKMDIMKYQNEILMQSVKYYRTHYKENNKYKMKYKNLIEQLQLYGIPYMDPTEQCTN